MRIVAKYIGIITAAGITVTGAGLHLLGLPPLVAGLVAAPFWLCFAFQVACRSRG